MERDKIEKRMGNETRKIKGNENRKMMISSDEWNALFGESDSEEEFEGFKAEDIEKCVGGVVKSHAATVCMEKKEAESVLNILNILINLYLC